jgi:hypothetical protein
MYLPLQKIINVGNTRLAKEPGSWLRETINCKIIDLESQINLKLKSAPAPIRNR